MPTVSTDVQAGICNVTFDGAALGLSKGGVKVEMTVSTYQIQVDQQGDSVIDEFIKGRGIKITVPMAESDVAKLVKTIPGATLSGTDNKTMSVPSGAGTSMRDFAKVLRLHPIGLDDSDVRYDITVPLAAPKGSFSLDLKNDAERIYSAEFTGFINISTGILFYFGFDASVVPAASIVAFNDPANAFYAVIV